MPATARPMQGRLGQDRRSSGTPATIWVIAAW